MLSDSLDGSDLKEDTGQAVSGVLGVGGEEEGKRGADSAGISMMTYLLSFLWGKGRQCSEVVLMIIL